MTAPRRSRPRSLQVTKQFDGVGDSPNYLFNIASNVNSALGSYYLHPDYYQNVDPTPDPTRTDAIVTTSADGNVTDVLILDPDGQLPLTRPLLHLGVPQDLGDRDGPVPAVGHRNRLQPADRSEFVCVRTGSVPAGASAAEMAVRRAVGGRGCAADDAAARHARAARCIERRRRRPAARVAETEEVAPEPSPKDDEEPVEAVEAVEAGPNKVEPPKHRAGGWRPGDLLRSIFGPKPKKDDSAQADEPSEAPPTPDAPTTDPGTATDADAEASGTATG